MRKERSPSPILGCFTEAVQRDFPAAQSAKLAAHQAAISRTTSRGDAHRARRCAEWAITMADDKDQSHPRWRELKELHQVWKDTWFGLEFARHAGESVIEDVKIQWTEDAVAVAKALGEEDGWDRSPWEALLAELIGIDTSHPSD
jgi:hypothetical protein